MGINVLNDEKIKTCSKCLLPETQETITFDDAGVCNVCRQHDYKKEKIDWTQRKKELNSLVEEHRGKGSYDCLIPFSGGKGSTFTLLYLMKTYKVKPLVGTFDHGFMRPTVLANTERVVKILGVDCLKFRHNWQI